MSKMTYCEVTKTTIIPINKAFAETKVTLSVIKVIKRAPKYLFFKTSTVWLMYGP